MVLKVSFRIFFNLRIFCFKFDTHVAACIVTRPRHCIYSAMPLYNVIQAKRGDERGVERRGMTVLPRKRAIERGVGYVNYKQG